MGYYKYIRKSWTKPRQNLGSEIWLERLSEWRRDPVFRKIDRPTRIDRARALGYKAKPGYIIIRTRIHRGLRKKEDWAGGRRPKRAGRLHFSTSKSLQTISEERISKKYPNCTVLNSYWVAEDGKYKYFEVIIVDRSNPVIKADRRINWICDKEHKGRAHRGLTSSGKRGRGLNKKGKGSEKSRPSLKANKRRAN